MSWKRINNWLWTLFLPHVPKAFCVYSFLASYATSKVALYIHICIYIRSYFILWLRRNKVQLLLLLRPTLPRSSWEPHRQRVGREMGSRKTCLRSSSLWQGAQTSDLHQFLPSTRLQLFLLYVIVMPSNFSTCSGFLPLAWSSVPWPIIQCIQHDPLHILVHPLEELSVFLPRECTDILYLSSVGHLDAMPLMQTAWIRFLAGNKGFSSVSDYGKMCLPKSGVSIQINNWKMKLSSVWRGYKVFCLIHCKYRCQPLNLSLGMWLCSFEPLPWSEVEVQGRFGPCNRNHKPFRQNSWSLWLCLVATYTVLGTDMLII